MKDLFSKPLTSLLAISLLGFVLSGCTAVVAGSVIGAAGGYIVSKDTIQGDTDKPYDSIWNAAKTIASEQGTIREENYKKGTLKIVAGDSSLVWIKLVRMTRATTRLKISCRRFHLPNLRLAQEIYTRIIDEVTAR